MSRIQRQAARLADKQVERRIRIAAKDAAKEARRLLRGPEGSPDAVREGRGEDAVWVVRYRGTVLRNRDRQAVLRDLLTINGYEVGDDGAG